MNAEQFDASISEWLAYQATPRGRLRATLLEQGVLRYLPPQPSAVLDIGGGTGELAERLLALGHTVTLADYSPVMLGTARARLGSAVTYVLLDLSAANNLPGAPYDVIVCHNVIEYVTDFAAAICLMADGLQPNGLLSLSAGNARHAPLQSAVVHRDFGRARRELRTATAESTNVFGTQTHVLDPDAVDSALAAAGLRARSVHGIRCVTDLLDSHAVADPTAFDALLALELDMMVRPAYTSIGRFVQWIATRSV